VPGLMRNITEVTTYLKKELAKPENKDVDQQILEPILTLTGDSFVKKNGYWRMFVFLDELKSYDQAESAEQVYEGAKSFGLFIRLLKNYPAKSLSVTIKDFHNIVVRLENLSNAYDSLEDGTFKQEVEQEIAFIDEVADGMSVFQELANAGKIPIRVTHNDTKFNNVLLDQNDIARCVIDLDTVMPGIVHYDFSDGIRTAACLAAEDERDLSLVDIDLERFEAFTKGFLENTRDMLTQVELDYLARSSALFPYMMGVRFLTDYMQGNTYYKIDYPDHNLVRSRAQLHLAKRILGRMAELESIVRKYR